MLKSMIIVLFFSLTELNPIHLLTHTSSSSLPSLYFFFSFFTIESTGWGKIYLREKNFYRCFILLIDGRNIVKRIKVHEELGETRVVVFWILHIYFLLSRLLKGLLLENYQNLTPFWRVWFLKVLS